MVGMGLGWLGCLISFHLRGTRYARWCIAGYQNLVIVLFIHSGMYPGTGTKPGCFGHTRVPNLVVFIILGYQTWLFSSYSGMYPCRPLCGTYPGSKNVAVLFIVRYVPR